VSAFQELPVGSISPNRRQPRTQFDEESLASLTASVRELGVLQPVLVRATGGGAYELIAGERRWRAAKRAGLSLIPAIVRTVDDTLSLEQALVENVQREDLNPLDEAAAYQQLLEDFHLTHDELATRVGRSRAAISNTLRLFQLPPAVQRMVAEGRLTAGHARALLTTPDRGYQEELAQRILGPRRRGRGSPAQRRATGPGAGPGSGLDGPGRWPATAGPARARGAALRPPGHPRVRHHGGGAGQGHHRVRHPRGSGTDLPGHDDRSGRRGMTGWLVVPGCILTCRGSPTTLRGDMR